MSTIITIKRKSGVSHRIQYYHNGQRHYETFPAGVPLSLVKARQHQIDAGIALSKAQLQPWHPHQSPPDHFPLARFAAWYRQLRTAEHNIAASTIDRYCLALAIFTRTIGPDHPLASITSADIETFKQRQLAQGKTKSGINKNLHHLHHPFKLAQQHQLILQIPVITKYKVPRRLPDFLLPEQLTELATHLPQGQVRLAFEIIKWTGIRRTELVERCLKHHFDFGTKKLTIIGKNNEILTVPLSQELINYLTADPIFQSRQPQDHIITLAKHSISDGIAKAKRRMKLDKRGRTHLLRHSFAIFLLYNGFNIKEVMRMLRHKTIYMTDLYTQAIETILSDKISNLKYEPLTIHSQTNPTNS